MPTAKPGPWLDDALARGLIRPEDLPGRSSPSPAREGGAPPDEGDEGPKRVACSFAPPGRWVLPIVTASESNLREWRKRSSRTGAARRAVSLAFGPALVWVAAFALHYHQGGALRVALTRLGGRQLDRSNLPAALKATEDAVALMLGADDGDPRWRAEWHQRPSGPVGVVVELEALAK